MRPHTIQNAEIPNLELNQAARFKRFVRGIVSVPKLEADKEEEKFKSRTPKSAKATAKREKK